MPLIMGILAQAAAAPVAAGAYDLLETQTLGTTAASVTFTGLGTLAAGYQHLQIRAVARSNGAIGANAAYAYLNGDTSASYASHRLEGNGVSVGSSSYVGGTNAWIGYVAGGNGTANVFGSFIVDFLDAFSTSKNTTYRSLNGNPDPTSNDYVSLYSGLYNKTDAMTSVTLFHGTGSWDIGSRFSLYGRAA